MTATSLRPLAVPVKEAARLLGISERHCYRLIEAGKIPARDLSADGGRRCLRVSTAWLEHWVGMADTYEDLRADA